MSRLERDYIVWTRDKKMKQLEHFLRRVAAILGFGPRAQVVVVYRQPPRYLR